MTTIKIYRDQVYPAREVTFGLINSWRQCRLSFLFKILGVPEQCTGKQRALQHLGKKVEQALSAETPVGADADLELPAEHQSEASRMIALSSRLSSSSGASVQKQVQFRWHDHVTGYDLFAKPDEVQYTSDAGGSVMRVIDDKITWRLKRFHRDQLRFFGLVASLSRPSERSHNRHQLRIELVVRLLGTPPKDRATGERLEVGERERKFPFSRSSQENELEAVRRTIRNLNVAREELDRLDLDGMELPSVLSAMRSHFPARRGGFCTFCSHRSLCPLFQGV